MDVLERIKNQVEAHPLIIYMKGNNRDPWPAGCLDCSGRSNPAAL